MHEETNQVKRGQIYWVNWEPSRGSEQNGRKPALIIQNDIANKFSPTTIVTTITAADLKAYPFIVNISMQESGLPKDSKINLSAILTIDKTRLEDRCGELSNQKMLEVDEAIKKSLALDERLK